MAEQRSIGMLAFSFASRTFVYRRLAQGLSRSLSSFSSFIREYLFFKELNEYAERAFGDQAHEMTDIFLYAKRPPHCERIFNLAYLQDGTRDQIVANLDKELELGGIENDGKLRIPTMLITAAKDNANKPNNSKIYCLYWKKLGHLNKNCRKRIRKEQEQKQDRAQNVKRFRAKAYSP